ncbi:hypothetical protein Nepgr_007821 [Nepenthes gracilis]|uniref:Uncharacterized protein n=1 Tax=Nepenthes gracilis TaxID=150966 RepID=A0AAD3S801_NEPGR|nr:hypothetical protein Nepgr_007821 [Nepenthes gracilis]
MLMLLAVRELVARVDDGGIGPVLMIDVMLSRCIWTGQIWIEGSGCQSAALELDSAMSSSGCHWAAVNMQSAIVSSCWRDEVIFVSPVANLVVRCADAVALFQFYVLLSDAAGLWFSMYDAHFDFFLAAMLSGCAGCSVGPHHAVPGCCCCC